MDFTHWNDGTTVDHAGDDQANHVSSVPSFPLFLLNTLQQYYEEYIYMSKAEIFFFIIQLAWWLFVFYYRHVVMDLFIEEWRTTYAPRIRSELYSFLCGDWFYKKLASKPTPAPTFVRESPSAPPLSSFIDKTSPPIPTPTFVRESPSAPPQYSSIGKATSSLNNTAPFFGSKVSTNPLSSSAPVPLETASHHSSYASTSSVEAIHVEAVTMNTNAATISPSVEKVAADMEKVAKVIGRLDLPTRVSMTPRKLMTALCANQGINLDPSEIEHAVNQIVETVGSSGGVCDGKDSYDVFINYRVSTDNEVATRLFLELKCRGIHAFLDSKCLIKAQPYQEGFLRGLSRSRKFLCLMSSAGLANVRDKTKDHTNDAVLLEYQTALMIRNLITEVDPDLAKSYIVPILVGHFSQGVLTKFTDFPSKTYYPDSVGPELDISVLPTSSSMKMMETEVEKERKRLSLFATEQAQRQAEAVKEIELELARMKVDSQVNSGAGAGAGAGATREGLVTSNVSNAPRVVPSWVQPASSSPSLRESVIAAAASSSSSSSPSLREAIFASSSSSSSAAAAAALSFIPALTSKGTPCKNCETLGQFCYQHK